MTVLMRADQFPGELRTKRKPVAEYIGSAWRDRRRWTVRRVPTVLTTWRHDALVAKATMIQPSAPADAALTTNAAMFATGHHAANCAAFKAEPADAPIWSASYCAVRARTWTGRRSSLCCTPDPGRYGFGRPT